MEPAKKLGLYFLFNERRKGEGENFLVVLLSSLINLSIIERPKHGLHLTAVLLLG